ncbi:SH3-like domain-containing protein [Cognatiyoonia sp. IB215182]|uniref:SH3-like domain-containing protein n=1 Tax=Cognatiyoonia sp. IB215182 TaxID=3097353 RepID=UPI002A0BE295|nr:SH3-like domain-containing protein [Cognatiyoonia sp. IB215182]MDX8352258.1 nitrile hydratase subunit beta [Cognatiyoonia sp. IB215182]
MVEWMRVRADMPPGHVRTPSYLRGKVGQVERRLGSFANPEQLAYGLPAEKLPLLRVRFTMTEIWGAEAAQPDDTIDVEIYSHWLEPVDAPHAP